MKNVNVQDEVLSLEGQLGYKVRAINSNLSGGQVQRLVIARALIRGASILLLDEATSAIDMNTEKDIIEGMIARCHKNKTSLIAVTHRLQNLESYDEVWYIEKARIALRGDHKSLLFNPRYREFCSAST